MDDPAPSAIRRNTLKLRKEQPAEGTDDRTRAIFCATGSELVIGRNVRVRICAINDGDNVRLGIEAPQDIPVHREEIYRLIRESERFTARLASPPLSGDSVSLQDRFLAVLCQDRAPVTIFLTNGGCARGVIRSFDAFTVLLDTQMLYKHLIATIQPTPGVARARF